MAPSTAAEVAFMSVDQLLKHWQGHRGLSRRMIEAYPEEELFSFSIGGMRPFGELVHEMIHMTVPIAAGAATGEWKEYGVAELPRTKSGLLELWDQDTQSLNEQWAKVTSERLQAKEVAFGQWPSRVFGHILYAIDNEVHHRAQGYVYLRALGIEPPPFWER